MPQVPVYGAPKVEQSVGPSNLGMITTHADSDSFGIGASAASGITNATLAVYRAAKEGADEVAVNEADMKASQAQQKLLYSQGDSDGNGAGLLTIKGKGALEAAPKTQEDFQSQMDNISEGLSTSQQAAFQDRYRRRQESMNNQIQQHVSTEMANYDNQTTQGLLDSEHNIQASNVYDNAQLTDSMSRQQQIMQQYAKRTGMAPALLDAKLAEAKSKTGMIVLNQMIADGNDMQAKNFFDQNKVAFAGDDLTHATKMVEEGSYLGESQRQGDQIMASTTSMSGAFAAAREIENPKLRQMTTERIQQQYSQKRLAENDAAQQNMKSAMNFIDTGAGYQAWANAHPSTWASLSESERNGIMNYKAGGQTNPQTFTDLKLMAVNDPEKFKQLDITKFRLNGDLAEGTFQALVGQQAELIAGKATPDTGIQSRQEIWKTTLRSVGIDPTDNAGKTDQALTKNYRTQLEQQVISQEQATGKKLDNTQVQKLADDLVKQQVTETHWYGDTKKYLFEINQDSANEIPQTEVAKINDALRRSGKSQTVANQLQLWQMKNQSRPGTSSAGN